MKPSEIRQLQIDTKYIIIGSILQKHGTIIKWQRVLNCTYSKVILIRPVIPMEVHWLCFSSKT